MLLCLIEKLCQLRNLMSNILLTVKVLQSQSSIQIILYFWTKTFSTNHKCERLWTLWKFTNNICCIIFCHFAGPSRLFSFLLLLSTFEIDVQRIASIDQSVLLLPLFLKKRLKNKKALSSRSFHSKQQLFCPVKLFQRSHLWAQRQFGECHDHAHFLHA